MLLSLLEKSLVLNILQIWHDDGIHSQGYYIRLGLRGFATSLVRWHTLNPRREARELARGNLRIWITKR